MSDQDIENEKAIDEISDKIADNLASVLIKGLIRSVIGLALFGALWYFFSWGRWLFIIYVILAPLSLMFQIFLHFKLAETVARASSIGDEDLNGDSDLDEDDLEEDA